jgi:hypothetical protein
MAEAGASGAAGIVSTPSQRVLIVGAADWVFKSAAPFVRIFIATVGHAGVKVG